MPTYTVTAHHTCMRCGATATESVGADVCPDGDFRVGQWPAARGWRDIVIPVWAEPALQGELCPDCLTAVAAFALPQKGS